MAEICFKFLMYDFYKFLVLRKQGTIDQTIVREFYAIKPDVDTLRWGGLL